MTAAPAALLLAALLPLPGATTPTPAPGPGRALVPRGRWHHELAGPTRVSWSVLFRRTDFEDETRLLVETPAGRYVLVSTQPADGSGTREEVSVPDLGESVSRLLEARPSGHVPECARVRPPDACVVLSGSRGRLAAPLSAFFGGEGPALRRRAAGVVSPPLLARLAGLAPALPIDDLAFYGEDFLALLDPALVRPGKEARPAPPRLPGCAWDATFGYPCTADESRREEWLFRRTPPPAPR
ncbi:MAG: hypothetical protein U0529_22705 [Thermoanaerobaculia bacterium]